MDALIEHYSSLLARYSLSTSLPVTSSVHWNWRWNGGGINGKHRRCIWRNLDYVNEASHAVKIPPIRFDFLNIFDSFVSWEILQVQLLA